MFKKFQAWRVKKKADKMAEDAKTVYVMSHILLILSNNLKAMKSINNQQKIDLYNLYVRTLFASMTDESRLIFAKAIDETTEALDKINRNIPSNQTQIQRQLQKIFNSGQ